MKEKLVKAQKGLSLIEVLISLALITIAIGFVADLLVKQFKEQRQLSQKFGMNDFKNNFLATIAKNTNCSCQFLNSPTNPNIANYGGLKFNSTIVDGSEAIEVKALYSGCAGGATAPLKLAENDQPLYGVPNLLVNKVRITNLIPSGGSGNPNEWQGQWEISFKVADNSTDRPIKPITLLQKFMIDPTAPTNARISSCLGLNSGSGTTNYLAKWSPILGILQDSKIYEDPVSWNMGIGTITPQRRLHIVGIDGVLPAPPPWAPKLGLIYENNANASMTIAAASNNLAGLQFSKSGSATDWNGAVIYDNAVDKMYFGTAGVYPKVTIDSAGRMGIGTPNPGYQLHLSTDSAAKPGTSTWQIASDRRLKNTLSPYERGLEEILKIKPIYFRYKNNNPLQLPITEKYVGLVAQEVIKVIPEAVKADEQGFLHITSDSIIWAMLNSIKELWKYVVEIKNYQLIEFKEKSKMAEKLEALEMENSQLKKYLCAKDPQAPFCN